MAEAAPGSAGATASAGLGVLQGSMQMAQAVNQYYALKAAGKNYKRYGKYVKALADSQQKAYSIAAGQQLAASQYAMQDLRMQQARAIGASRARAAASGAAVASPSIIQHLADVRGAYDTAVGRARYQGESAAKALEYQGAMEATEGQAYLESMRLARDQFSSAATNQLVTGLFQGAMGMAGAGMKGTGMLEYEPPPAPTAPAKWEGWSGSPYLLYPENQTGTGSLPKGQGWEGSPYLLSRNSAMYNRYGQGGP